MTQQLNPPALPAPLTCGGSVVRYEPPGAAHYGGEPDGQGFHWWPCGRCGCWYNGGDHDDGPGRSCSACRPATLAGYARRPWWWPAEQPYTAEDAMRLRAEDHRAEPGNGWRSLAVPAASSSICTLCGRGFDTCEAEPGAGCIRHTLRRVSTRALCILQSALEGLDFPERQAQAVALSRLLPSEVRS